MTQAQGLSVTDVACLLPGDQTVLPYKFSSDMARDKVDDWGKLDKKIKQLTLKKYALLKMKMI